MTDDTKGKLVSRISALIFMGAAVFGSFAMLSSGERQLLSDPGTHAAQTTMAR
ncbi:MAG: hypothetical protein ABMA14_06565 [Hyphomonadaceae bacterium]